MKLRTKIMAITSLLLATSIAIAGSDKTNARIFDKKNDTSSIPALDTTDYVIRESMDLENGDLQYVASQLEVGDEMPTIKPVSINDKGQYVAIVSTYTNDYFAGLSTVTSNSQEVIDLGTLNNDNPNTRTRPYAINNNGQIVGVSSYDDWGNKNHHGVLIEGTGENRSMVDLGADIIPLDINDNGDIVYIKKGQNAAFISSVCEGGNRIETELDSLSTLSHSFGVQSYYTETTRARLTVSDAGDVVSIGQTVGVDEHTAYLSTITDKGRITVPLIPVNHPFEASEVLITKKGRILLTGRSEPEEGVHIDETFMTSETGNGRVWTSVKALSDYAIYNLKMNDLGEIIGHVEAKQAGYCYFSCKFFFKNNKIYTRGSVSENYYDGRGRGVRVFLTDINNRGCIIGTTLRAVDRQSRSPSFPDEIERGRLFALPECTTDSTEEGAEIKFF